jgi:hypothetical protein
MTQENDGQTDKFVKLEANLLEQEHRLFNVIYNWMHRSAYETSDPRYKAVGRALLWRLLFSPNTVAVGSSLIGAFTLFVLWWQSSLLSESNRIAEKNHRELMEQSKRQFSAFGFVEAVSIERDGIIRGRFVVLNPGNTPLYYVQGGAEVVWTETIEGPHNKSTMKSMVLAVVLDDAIRFVKPHEAAVIPFSINAPKEMVTVIETPIRGLPFGKSYDSTKDQESVLAKIDIYGGFFSSGTDLVEVKSEIHVIKEKLGDNGKYFTELAIYPDGPESLEIVKEEELIAIVKKVMATQAFQDAYYGK